MSADFFVAERNRVNQYLSGYFSKNREHSRSQELWAAMEYSVLNGGKRFRSILSLIVGEVLGVPADRILPWAAALELIHAFSLVHDDLPCMDNDDWRRGVPTTHKKFGEALALLAGDALQTEAFLLLAQNYSERAAALVRILAEVVGAKGMTGGQTMDMLEKISTVNRLKELHLGKTAALITAAVVGPMILAGRSESEVQKGFKMGESLGLAFQIQDDLLDKDDDVAHKNYISFLGEEKTKEILSELEIDLQKYNEQLFGGSPKIVELVKFNSNRSY